MRVLLSELAWLLQVSLGDLQELLGNLRLWRAAQEGSSESTSGFVGTVSVLNPDVKFLADILPIEKPLHTVQMSIAGNMERIVLDITSFAFPVLEAPLFESDAKMAHLDRAIETILTSRAVLETT